MMPNTSVSPAASKNNSTTYCTPLSSWDKTIEVIHFPLWETVNVDRCIESVASAPKRGDASHGLTCQWHTKFGQPCHKCGRILGQSLWCHEPGSQHVIQCKLFG